jgi:hypothetical protein
MGKDARVRGSAWAACNEGGKCMRRILLLAASAVLAAAGALAAAGPASAQSGEVTCPNGFLGVLVVPHDLTVPPDGSCGLTQGSTIGHDVTVDPGGTFYIGGTTIGHDLTATGAEEILLGDVNNGSTDTIIGGNVTISGTIGPGEQFICQTRIAGNLSITGTQTTSSVWYIGVEGPEISPHSEAGCSALYGARFGDTIGGDATFSNNASGLDVRDNQPATNGGTGPGFGHDLTLTGNTNTTRIDGNNIVHDLTLTGNTNTTLIGNNNIGNDLTLTGNTNTTLIGNNIGHDCTQSDNHPFTGSGNTAGSSVDACNSSNP